VNRSQAALALRGPLLVATVAAVATVGARLADGAVGTLLAVVFTVAVIVAWTVLRVPGDPLEAVVPIPGVARLLLELAVVVGAVAGLWLFDAPAFAVVLAGLAAAQYWAASDRVSWLVGLPHGSDTTRDPRA